MEAKASTFASQLGDPLGHVRTAGTSLRQEGDGEQAVLQLMPKYASKPRFQNQTIVYSSSQTDVRVHPVGCFEYHIVSTICKKQMR